jgi:AraC-like DNA-binding protein
MAINYFDIENGVFGYSQKDYQLKRHSHFPIEVVFTLSGQLSIDTHNHQYTNIQAAIINSKVPHTFNCLNSACQLYFIEPTSLAGKHILRSFFSRDEEMVLMDGVEAEYFKDEHIFAYRKHHVHLKPLDDRIQICLDWIKANYSVQNIQLSMLSEIAFLSESRLAHLFKEQIGIPVHQYILWKKIEMAIKQFMEGSSLTDCAYSSGFADPSHLNKTFKKMFGVYPSFERKK